MDVQFVSTVAGVVLGTVFLVSGGAKVARPREWSELSAEFGAPRLAGSIVPWLELVVGALLVTQVGAPYVGLVALTMLAAFSVAIATRLRQGRHPRCACFGAWSAKPLSGRHLVRNGLLAILAVLAAL